VGPIVAWLCTEAAHDVTGQVFHSVGTTIGVWTSYTTAREHDGGGHRTRGPWTMEELDAIVPTELLPDGARI
jgi:hypothetical protein